MTEETYTKFIFTVEGDVVKTRVEQNLDETLPNLDPIPGAFIGTMLLAHGVLLKNQDRVVEVIELLGTKEDIDQAHAAIQAAYILVQIDKAKKDIEEAEQN